MPTNGMSETERLYNQMAMNAAGKGLTKQPKQYRLIIFDLDGTLADFPQGDILPGVKEWFTNHRELQRNAIASNQGGVGLRYWMERDHFGDPSKYPTEDEVWAHIASVIEQLDPTMYAKVCFAYRAKSGKWAPMPEDKEGDPCWLRDYRKPAPGMLNEFMGTIYLPSETLMVGDSVEDEQAAQVAGCDFQWAWDFFGRPNPTSDNQESK